MKTARMHILVVEFQCPSCNEYCPHESGSHNWGTNEQLPEVLECESCNEKFRVPSAAYKLFGQAKPGK